MANQKDYNVRSVERAMDILACFEDAHPEMGIIEIAQAVGLNKTTAYRIATTLLEAGYIERGSDGVKYRLGLRLADLGYRFIRSLDLRREAYPVMFQLVQRFGEACDLGVFDRGEVFIIEYVKGNQTLAIADAIGMHLPAYCTASGKLFLAYLPGHELESTLSHPLIAYTEHTLVKPEELLQDFERIHQLGYAVDDEEHAIGERAVAAPIRNSEGKVVATLGIPGPASRITPDRTAEMGEALREYANAISRRLGWK
jgi:IclR family KDG regulon transcriptional repressor